MVFQPVPETAEIDIIFTYNGVTVQNVHYARLPGGYSLADLQALADAVDLVWPTTTINDVPAEVEYVKVEVRGLEFENDQIAQSDLSAGPGTDPTAPLPNNVTFAIKKSSGLTGRSARGRVFWIGITKSKIDPEDENLLTTTFEATVVADIDFIRVTIASVGLWEPVLVSRFTGGEARAEGKTFPWISTSSTDRRVDTHRGRLPSA